VRGTGNLRVVVRRCYQYAVLLAIAVWLLIAVCTSAVVIAQPGFGVWLALGMAVFSATTGAVVILPPFLLSQTLIGGLLAWSGARVTVRSCAVMVVGTAVAAFLAWAAFRLMLSVPEIGFFSLFPLTAVLYGFNVHFGGPWFLPPLGAQGLLTALSWWHLRRERLLFE
jgi:hypothetical protein